MEIGQVPFKNHYKFVKLSHEEKENVNEKKNNVLKCKKEGCRANRHGRKRPKNQK